MITIKTKEVVDAESSQFMGESGIYPVTIVFASLDQSAKSEAIQVNFHVQYGTGEQTLYGPYVQDSTGKALTIGVNLVSSLGVIAGMGDGEQLELEEEEDFSIYDYATLDSSQSSLESCKIYLT